VNTEAASSAPAVFFVSDVHLDAARPEITERFERFLCNTAKTCRALYLLGDIFESWIGDDDPSPLAKNIQQQLRQLADSGIRCYFMAGNRDFLLGEAWLRQAGLTRLPDPCLLPPEDAPEGLSARILLSHGDALCTDDTAYQKVRHMLRDPQWQKDFLQKPLAERKQLAEAARAQSRAYVSAANDSIMDVNQASVDTLMDAYQADILIHGHTHRPAIHRWHAPTSRHWRQRLVLGDWHHHSPYLRLEDHKFRLITC